MTKLIRLLRLTLAVILPLATGCSGSVGPSMMPTTTASRAALLAGDYALTITVDDRCSGTTVPTWTYRAHLINAGGYVAIQVVGGGYTESTDVGQVYTFPDFTARFVWNFDYPDFNYPKPRMNALLLYGSSETTIRNGTMSGTIMGTASTTLDLNDSCYGSHRFALISTGG